MALEQRRRTSLRLDLSQSSPLESPPSIAALFLIRFDIKKGYVVSWKESIPGVNLEGAVEYKSLPSGLHNVEEDLVYFIHDQYAGISAFVNQPAAEAQRNALMLAVGALVPLSFGRLGKSWRHALGLRDLAKKCAEDITNTQALVEYWDKHHVCEDDVRSGDSPPDSPAVFRMRSRADRPDTLRGRGSISDATGSEAARPVLAPFHPALSLPDFIAEFGPLIFPLFRASLLRKRILIITEAPVQTACDYVYGLSLLSSLPQSLSPLLNPDGTPPLRPRPLFNVGIHDIPFLSAASNTPSGWIACTTDNVLATKPELFDVLVQLPPKYSKSAAQKVYPAISVVHQLAAKGKPAKLVPLKATQRDARRFAILSDGLRRLSNVETEDLENAHDDLDTASTFSSSPIIEPLSWPRLAYTSFLWWASAGEKRAVLSDDETEQDEQDTNFLASTHLGQLSHPGLQVEESNQPQEIALIAYFRRLTTLTFTVLADAVARQEEVDGNGELPAYYYDEPTDEAGEGEDETRPNQPFTNESDEEPLLLSSTGNRKDGQTVGPVLVTSADMAEMGLDVWSGADRIFLENLLQSWWGRKAYVDSTRIRCCGIPIF
ncbi:hypothetical protein BGW36DRAFT_293412 [Talaromyces proteolyticus]|uniref:DUF4484 domain-containing protein n=1 Tax=Talaromyces proteolyticus TaxID=1131652 RepID=A0AAD4KRM3_9EURO|nr:uncharacterized protein BGW36DRAFT_293412 [Talaromyces proteolyticus]KAH8698884.1 hypothetical protein BGW36DRAFT_293412 [Talaromyces proteolyticus]